MVLDRNPCFKKKGSMRLHGTRRDAYRRLWVCWCGGGEEKWDVSCAT